MAVFDEQPVAAKMGYSAPTIKSAGSIAELTRGEGAGTPITDGDGYSVPSSGVRH
jgi:hypothetical protein